MRRWAWMHAWIQFNLEDVREESMKKLLISILVLVLSVTACMVTNTRLRYHKFESEMMGNDVNYGVYIPPGWDERTPLPLIVFLHGAGDDEGGREPLCCAGDH